MDQQMVRADRLVRELPLQRRVEGYAKGSGYELELNHARWTRQGERTFHTERDAVDFTLASTAALEVNTRRGDPAGYRSVDGVCYIPSGADLHYRWRPGLRRSLTCVIDFDQIPGAEHRSRGCEPETITEIRSPDLSAALRRLAEEVVAPGFASELHIHCLLTMVAIDLQRGFARQAPGQALCRGRLTAAQLRALRDMVEDGETPPTLAQMGEACGVSPRYLSILYRNTTGRTLRSYVADGRIERAKSQLQGREVLIKQVAHASGFQSAAAFAAAFRKATGLTPRQYRQSAGLPAA